MKAAKIRLAGVAVALFSGALFATDYYVDANNGNDDWDGTSATRGAGDVGPKKTLVGAMAITGLGSGDVVHAAEGVYDEKEAWAADSSMLSVRAISANACSSATESAPPDTAAVTRPGLPKSCQD